MEIIKTNYGKVRGVAMHGYTEFRAIPYAAPPVGNLRFRPAESPEKWEGVRDCTQWAPVSIQKVKNADSGTDRWIGSEDCLYLNIYTPASCQQERLPVILWIHGGGWAVGSGNDELLRGSAWMKKGVILVGVTYRLGALGFMGLNSFANCDPHGSTGNYGLTDILAALRWVRNNIEAFGGDPDNLTVAGQSSGAMAVRWLLVCHESRGTFRHAIAQSGGGLWDIDAILPQTKKCLFCTKALELAGWTERDLLERDAVEISMVMDSVMPMLQIPQKSICANLFQPNMDGWLVRDLYGKLINQGDSVDADIMAGMLREEWGNFPYQVKGGISGYEYEFAAAPVIAWAMRQNELGKKPIYSYFFDHDLPGEPSAPRHSSEMPYTFGKLDTVDRQWTAYDWKMSETLVDYWTNFAKYGNPNGCGCPQWPAFTQERPVTMHIRNDGLYADDMSGEYKISKVVRFLMKYPGIIDVPFCESVD